MFCSSGVWDQFFSVKVHKVQAKNKVHKVRTSQLCRVPPSCIRSWHNLHDCLTQVRRIICVYLAAILCVERSRRRPTKDDRDVEEERLGLDEGFTNDAAEEAPRQASSRIGAASDPVLIEIRDLLRKKSLQEQKERARSKDEARIRQEWILAARVVNRLCFVFFASVLVGVTLVFFTVFHLHHWLRVVPGGKKHAQALFTTTCRAFDSTAVQLRSLRSHAVKLSSKGVPRSFHWGRRPKVGVQQPLPASYGVSGCAVNAPARFGAEPRPPKGFPLFTALRMASPDTIILLKNIQPLVDQVPRSHLRKRPFSAASWLSEVFGTLTTTACWEQISHDLRDFKLYDSFVNDYHQPSKQMLSIRQPCVSHSPNDVTASS